MSTADWDRSRWWAAMHAGDHLATEPDTVLIDAMHLYLERMGKPEADLDTNRWAMGRIVSELARRHQLEVVL